jgi:tetratricopeptide (TPR) repeat protein
MTRGILSLLLVLSAATPLSAQGIEALRAGNAAFDARRLDVAEARYREAARDTDAAPLAWLNLGLVMAARGQDALAARTFAGAADRAASDADKARAHYNRGVVLARSGQLREALGAFMESMRRDPRREDARVNFAIVRARLEQENRGRATPPPEAPDETRQALEQVPAQSFAFTQGARKTRPVKAGDDW